MNNTDLRIAAATNLAKADQALRNLIRGSSRDGYTSKLAVCDRNLATALRAFKATERNVYAYDSAYVAAARCLLREEGLNDYQPMTVLDEV